MLGTLAKWLRILGYDTVYEPDLAHSQQYEPYYRTYVDVFEKMQTHFAR